MRLKFNAFGQPSKMTLRRFLVMYCVFSIVIFSMLLPVYLYVRKTVYQVELNRCQTRLQTGVDTLVKAVSAMRNLSVTTESDYRFKGLIYQQGSIDPLALKEMNKVFSGLLLNENLITDAALILPSGIVFTRQRVFLPNAHYHFYPDYFSCGSLDYGAFLQLLSQNNHSLLPETACFSGDYFDYNALIYASRWPNGYLNSHCYLFATIKTSAIYEVLADADVLADGEIRIQAADGRLLAQKSAPDLRGYTEISCSSPELKAMVTISISPVVLNSRLAYVNRMFQLFIAFLGLGVITSIFVFAWRSARPMSDLLSRLPKLLPEEKLSGAEWQPGRSKTLRQDYDYLTHSIQSMGNRIKNDHESIQALQQELRSNIWGRALLYGLYSQKENSQFLSAFPDFPEEWRLMLLEIVSDPENTSMEARAQKQLWLRAMLSQRPGAVIVEQIEGAFISVLLSGSAVPAVDDLEQQEDILSCAVTEPGRGPDSLHHAYQQAVDLIYMPGEKLPFLRTSQTVPSGSAHLPFSMQDEEILYKALRTGSLPTALYLLENCTRELESMDEAGLWRFIFQRITSVVARLRLENPAPLFHIIIPSYNYSNRQELFTQSLPACFQAVCDSLDVLRQEAGKDFVAYIHAHLSDSQLSVARLAEVFHLSSPTLQKIFKNETGMTIAAYIEKARIDLAEKLLNETWLSIAEITERCGYTSPNTFSKAFKRCTGVAPVALQRTKKPKAAN